LAHSLFVFVSTAPATVIDCCVNFVVVAAVVLNGNCFEPTDGERVFRGAGTGVQLYKMMLHGEEPGDLATLHGR